MFKISAYLRDNGIYLPVTVEISRLYRAHPNVLPHPNDWTKLAVLVVNLLSGFRSNANSSNGNKNDDEQQFASDTEEISQILPLIWGRSETVDGIQECLKAFYVIISTEGKQQRTVWD